MAEPFRKKAMGATVLPHVGGLPPQGAGRDSPWERMGAIGGRGPGRQGDRGRVTGQGGP